MRTLSERVEIEAPAPVVWDVLADFGGVANWAPYMRTSHLIGERKSGVGTRRGMRHAWGFRFEELVTEWKDGQGYTFNVLRAPYPMKDVQESWVNVCENGCQSVRTEVRYGMRLGLLGTALDWLLVRFVVRREMRAGLRGLKQHIESEAAVRYGDQKGIAGT